MPCGQYAAAGHTVANPAIHTLPAGHIVGAVEAAAHTVPFAQGICTDAFGQKKPAAHGSADVVPTGHHFPPAHATCEAAELHTYPSGQGTSTEEPAGHVDPVAQAVAFPCKHMDPAGHTVCAVALAGHEYPSPHFCMLDVTLQ